MNGVEKITAKILGAAEAEAKKIKAEADAECAGIMKKYEEQAAKESAELLESGKREAESLRSSSESSAAMEAKRGLLKAKQELIGRAFERAEELIVNMPEDKYAAFLASLVVKAAVSGDEELIFSASDRKRVGRAVADGANRLLGEKGRLRLSERTADIKGGVILDDGRVETNCGVETLVTSLRASLTPETAALLFA